MARVPTDPDSIADLRLYLQGVAKYLVDRLYGPDGPARGTALASLEKAVEAVRLALSEPILGVDHGRKTGGDRLDDREVRQRVHKGVGGEEGGEGPGDGRVAREEGL